jgi:hypothetical protein
VQREIGAALPYPWPVAPFPRRPSTRLLRRGGITASALLVVLSSFTAAVPAGATPVDPRQVFAIGDSVMLGAKSCLQDRGYTVDAQGSRQAWAVAEELRSASLLPRQIVIHTGTNGGATRKEIRRIVQAIGPLHEVVLLTVQLPNGTTRYTFEDSTNRAIRAIADRYPNVHVADWNEASDRHPGWTWGDGIHLTPKGCLGFTRVVTKALRDATWLPYPYFPMRSLSQRG